MMKEKSTMQIEISGHTDNAGPDEYNLNLSQRRANSVVQYLSQKSIGKDRMNVVFFGESKPVDTNDTVEGRKRNRRVEFKILKL
jgi:outer membrane protein OmpA-like peptidoglycan-associated protein